MATATTEIVKDLALQRINSYGYTVSSDESLLYAVARAMEFARNFCHLEELPFDMKYALADIAVSYYLEPLADSGELAATGDISSINVGDTSVSFSSTSSVSTAKIASDLIEGGRRELLRFRKLLF